MIAQLEEMYDEIGDGDHGDHGQPTGHSRSDPATNSPPRSRNSSDKPGLISVCTRHPAADTVGGMKVDAHLPFGLERGRRDRPGARSRRVLGGWTAETNHDPFLPLALAAEHTDEIELGTSIAVAFARNPMLLANIGWDLQSYSGGRFILGLGSQIKPHITKRFSMQWSHPAPRMRELDPGDAGDLGHVAERRRRSAFRGEFYPHTLMTPFFTPTATDLGDFGVPKVFLAGVGELMTEVAGEVCDGFLCHGVHHREVPPRGDAPGTRARPRQGRQDDGGLRDRRARFVVTGTTTEMRGRGDGTRQQIAFYGSTPAYRGVLERTAGAACRTS